MNVNEHRSLKQLPVARLLEHPDNPRKHLGDLTELAESVRTIGILQNLTVTPAELVDGVNIPDGEHQYYVVIIGHRRLAAAKMAGLETVPCADISMDRKEQLSTMLMENMQRSDLTPYEQAWGFHQMSLLGCVYIALYRCVYGSNGSYKDVCEAIGVRPYEYKTGPIIQGIGKITELTATKKLLGAVYAMYADGPEETFATCMEVTGELPRFSIDSNTKLRLLYEWLISLGYECCDEENQMLNGSHELYHMGKKKGAKA